jgi:hypothetical protein
VRIAASSAVVDDVLVSIEVRGKDPIGARARLRAGCDDRDNVKEDTIMKIKLFSALAAAALLAGAALAIQYTGSAPMQDNLIAKRLPGQWVIDARITAQLDPQSDLMAPRTWEFTSDDTVLRKLVTAYPRFGTDTIYLSGTAHMGSELHWFVITSDFGNNHLVLFTPTRDGAVGEPHYFAINMVASRKTSLDLLFIGGDYPRESAVAYDRMR